MIVILTICEAEIVSLGQAWHIIHETCPQLQNNQSKIDKSFGSRAKAEFKPQSHKNK
jgi:hypothetical protein